MYYSLHPSNLWLDCWFSTVKRSEVIIKRQPQIILEVAMSIVGMLMEKIKKIYCP